MSKLPDSLAKIRDEKATEVALSVGGKSFSIPPEFGSEWLLNPILYAYRMHYISGFDACYAELLPVIEEMRLKNEKLVVALQFYARGEHWTLRPMIGDTICDKGEVAKKALADIDTKERG